MELKEVDENKYPTRLSEGQTHGSSSGKQQKRSIKEVAVEFGQNTTAHGVGRLVAADSTYLKLIWLCICLLCWGVFLWQAAMSIQLYFTYDISYDISVDFRILEFPAVTVCNINPVRQSKLSDLPAEVQGQLPFLDFDATDNNETEFNWQDDIQESLLDEDWWDDGDGEDFEYYDTDYQEEMNFTLVMSHLTDEMRAEIGHQKTDFILDCQFNGMKCSPNNFSLVQNAKYGNCYSFNVGFNGTDIVNSSRPGPSTGLKLILFIEQDEYLYGHTESAGVIVLPHPHRSVPFPEENGIEIPPGFSSSIGIRLSEVHRLDGDYGNCLDDWPETPIYQGYEYSVEVKYTVVQYNTAGKID